MIPRYVQDDLSNLSLILRRVQNEIPVGSNPRVMGLKIGEIKSIIKKIENERRDSYVYPSDPEIDL